MPRTEFGVAVASILIVAGVLAIPLVAPPASTQVPATIHQPIIRPTASATPSASDLVGSGCAAYEAQVPTGAGSIVGMSSDLLTQAASNNPQLTKLTAAVSGKLNPSVNLVSTLDNGQYTVFAPVDSAWAKLPSATLSSLAEKSNASKLTGILEYHVVKGEFAPDKVDGMLPNLEGGTLTVAGSGNSITVNGANVVCGGIQTSNAVVYLIDTVLTPPATN